MTEFRKFLACKAPDCERNAHRSGEGKLGFCALHYQRWRRHGDPLVVNRPPSPAQDWIRDHVTHRDEGCLLWPFHIGSDGYARAHRPGSGELTTAANLMCEAAHGPAPSPEHECAHSCGRGDQGCVHPQHLRWATPQENQQERVDHGTSNRGERQWQARLTADDVRAIRRLATTMTQAAIAKQFGVRPDHVSRIVRREKWAWLA
jgi:hypothetical protein